MFQIRLGTVADLAGAAGLADPTPISNCVEGAAQFAQGHWQDGLITVGVGSVPFIGRWAVRWVRGGKTAGVVAHAEPGLIATVPGLPRQGGLNHLEPPALGRPHFDPALGNHPPMPGTRPRPTPHEQPVPVGSAEPPIPRPEPPPTSGGGAGGGGGTTVPPAGTGRPNPYLNLTREQLESSKAAYNKLIREHEQKLADFLKDPIGNRVLDGSYLLRRTILHPKCCFNGRWAALGNWKSNCKNNAGNSR